MTATRSSHLSHLSTFVNSSAAPSRRARWIGEWYPGLYAYDSLDEPLHLQILTSIASSLARHPPPAPEQGRDDHLDVIVKGLPDEDLGDDIDEWVRTPSGL